MSALPETQALGDALLASHRALCGRCIDCGAALPRELTPAERAAWGWLCCACQDRRAGSATKESR